MEKLLKAIREALGLAEDADTDKVIAAMKKDGKDLWQAIFDEGHGVAYAQQQAKIDRLTNEKAALVTDRDKAKSDLAEARKGTPNVEALQEQIDAKDAEIERLNTERVNDKRQWKVDSVRAKLRAKLAPEVVDGYDEYLADRESTRELLSFDDDGNFRVLRPGKATPFTGDEDAQIEALAKELLKGVKPALRRSDVDRGSGSDGESGGGASKGALFDKVREDAKKQTGDAPVDLEKELSRRLGLGVS